jgi:AcrR family transcriptional regulator
MRRLSRLMVQTTLKAGAGAGTPPLPGTTPNEAARVAVLDAAVARFAAVGFSKPALDDVARSAGVSTADVVSLFSGEEGLRRACDDYVLRALVGWAQEKATLEGMSEVMRSYAANPRSYEAQIGYLGRVVAEDSPAAAQYIEVLVDESESIIRAGIIEGTMRPSEDPRALAVLLATTVVGLVTMAPHIERVLGVPDSQQQMMLRLAVPALEVYTHGLYTDDSYLRLVREAVAALAATPGDRQTPGAELPDTPPHLGGT